MSTYYILADIDIQTGKTTFEQLKLERMPYGLEVEESIGFIPSYE